MFAESLPRSETWVPCSACLQALHAWSMAGSWGGVGGVLRLLKRNPPVDPHVSSVLPILLSSHNWNTLFMGPNAVADAIAQKYNASKSQVFDHVSEGLSVVYFIASLSQGRCLGLDSC